MCIIIQWYPSYCLHVKRVKRLCYVHNIDAFSAMLKGSKENVIHVHNIDTFNAMLKELKDYVIYTI